MGLSRFPTVTETFILREVTEMERQGQPVRLVPLIRENPPVVHDAAKPWMQRALFTPWLSLRIALANLGAFICYPLRYTSTLLGIILGTLKAPKSLIGMLGIFPKSVFLARQLATEGVKHIHVHYASHPATMALIVSKFAPITYSFTVHAFDIQGDRSLLDWKIRESRFVRSISQYNKRFLEGLYPKDAHGKIEVIHVGIEPDVYANDVAPVPGRILCVAGHRPYKGLPYLIEACRILRDEGIDFECNLVGHGPMHDELESMIRDRNLGDRVHLIGPRPEEEVAKMMREASLFVLPSIVDKDGMMEGIPVALMEAMATGRAVVSTTTAGIPELVDHGVSGLLVPPQDPTALANAIKTLLSDPVKSKAMGARGQEKVRAEFDLRDSAAQLLALTDRENR
ncbi:MAG TPA: glycosyltransferase family 4 protein [Thermoanaerobaculia bacterium]|nr:glycosyltransferase family 4 protein [Thermoanaerobaculia bacterium]